jgi:hypothetical protein
LEAFELVTSRPDGRLIETITPGSLVSTSKTLFPAVSPSTVKLGRVEAEFAVRPDPRTSYPEASMVAWGSVTLCPTAQAVNEKHTTNYH